MLETKAVNRSTNASQSPVPRRPEQDSQLGTSTDASGYKNRGDDESINKKILRNKLKEIEDAGYSQKEKKSSVEPAASESRNYTGRGANTSYTNTSTYGATNTSALREAARSREILLRRRPLAKHQHAGRRCRERERVPCSNRRRPGTQSTL